MSRDPKPNQPQYLRDSLFIGVACLSLRSECWKSSVFLMFSRKHAKLPPPGWCGLLDRNGEWSSVRGYRLEASSRMSRFKSSSSAGIFPSVASKSSLKIASSSGMVVLCIDFFMVQFQISCWCSCSDCVLSRCSWCQGMNSGRGDINCRKKKTERKKMSGSCIRVTELY